VKDTFLDIHKSALKNKGAYFTATEISRQPQSWKKTLLELKERRSEFESFLESMKDIENLQVVLTGAGSSAFIGEVLQYAYKVNFRKDIKAIATTDLVTHFESLIQCDKPLLLISFARSGNSPESMATIQLANELCTNNIFHLIITCNPEGKLNTEVSGEHVITFLLPGETNDQSLAMTNSFSSMMIAGFLLSDLDHLDQYEEELADIGEYAEKILSNYLPQIRKIAESDFERAIFLGSGPFLGIARESHLKLQELTDGHVICKFDSFLGFRHGPKAVVDEKTLIVYLVSNSDYVKNYEMDLIKEIQKNGFGEQSLAIVENSLHDRIIDQESCVLLSDEVRKSSPFLMGGVYVMVAQLLGFFKSLHFGLEPDNPSRKGAISRVVQGVQIYPYDYQEIQDGSI